MKIIDVKNIDEAVNATKKILDKIFHQNVINSIVFTGGRFGESIVSSFKHQYITESIQIYQTDERFVNYDDKECIQAKLQRSFSELGINLLPDQLNFFKLDTLSLIHI